MNILVIAPDHADLPNASSEIAAIDQHHDARILRGTVREADIAGAVDEADFDVIWWITHGSPTGVLLSDGLLSTAGVGQYVRSSRAGLCVLNSCESEDIALSIVAGGLADMICTIGLVSNRDAIRLGILLAGELAESGSYYAAYEIVAPDGGPYRYLAADVQFRRHRLPDNLREIDHRALEDRARIQAMIIVLILFVLFGGFGLYRELTVIEANQAKILNEVREVQIRLIQLAAQRTPFSERYP